MQITGVAQSCQSGNQAEFTRRGHVSTDQQKNFIGKNISRLIIGYIEVSNGLLEACCFRAVRASVHACVRDHILAIFLSTPYLINRLWEFYQMCNISIHVVVFTIK